MSTSPREDEPEDSFLRDPSDLDGFLEDVGSKGSEASLPFEPEDGQAGGARAPFWGAGAVSDPSGAGSASGGGPEPPEAGDDRVWEALGAFDEASEAGDDSVWEAMGLGEASEAGGDRYAGGDGAPEVGTNRAAEVAGEAPDEAEADPTRFWGTGFVPAAGEDELTAGLARLERLMWDGGDH